MNILETSTRHFYYYFDSHYTSYVPVEKLLRDVNATKSSGQNILPPQLIKASAAAIAKPIPNIFNASTAQGCYPSAWKKGQATVLLKKNDEFKKENYRLVAVLPALNNIYVRLLVAQLGDLYQAILSNLISSHRKFQCCEDGAVKVD